jgi:hypothetical protein
MVSGSAALLPARASDDRRRLHPDRWTLQSRASEMEQTA